MKETTHRIDAINSDLLFEELQAALGDKVMQIASGPNAHISSSSEGMLSYSNDPAFTVIVRLTDDADSGHAELVRKVVAEHDASKLTALQQKHRDSREARQKLVAELHSHREELNALSVTETGAIGLMAAKLALLLDAVYSLLEKAGRL